MQNYSKITPKSQAVALGYDAQKDTAPQLLAVGNNLIADQIIEIAREHNIPIHRDADLVRILSLLEINSYIPLEVYGVVAKIISYIHSQNNQNKNIDLSNESK